MKTDLFSSPVEIMNNSIRAKATGLTTSASWLANFMIGQVTPKAFAKIGKMHHLTARVYIDDITSGWKYYLVFTICSFTNALFFYLFFPETKVSHVFGLLIGTRC